VADPRRLVDDPDASPLARELLASADGDAPTRSQRAAAAQRLGIAAALLTASGEVGAGGVVGALWWKIGLIVVALGGAVTGGAALLREPAASAVVAAGPARASGPAPARARAGEAAPAIEPEQAVEAEQAVVPATPASAARAQASATSAKATAPAMAAPKPIPPKPMMPATAAPKPMALVAPTAPAPTETTPAAAPAAASAAPAVPAIDARRLVAEVAVLDRARAALRRGDAAGAAAALDEHARAFADGALLAEAELLRIEALAAAGDAAQARRRARDFLSRFPQSPLAKRLRSLVDRLPAPSPAKESP